ncbi:hypothetical protein F5148DRAFT_545898 [Russula earlei]|uniref:Uncharacterized protein n=1 Tax=Russula earlei TaxID=71964 RepID=A0ACC0TW45_9AGAM|nr:hypothetical protein F5148DRAFT_545898 [Russula earlei]
MGNFTSKNNSGFDLTLTFPDSQVFDLKDKTELDSIEPGEYFVNNKVPIYSFTLYQGITIADLTSIDLDGSVTFKNSTESDLTLVLPTGLATFFPKGSTANYSNTGTYSIHAGPALPTPVFNFKYHRGTLSIETNLIFSEPGSEDGNQANHEQGGKPYTTSDSTTLDLFPRACAG